MKSLIWRFLALFAFWKKKKPSQPRCSVGTVSPSSTTAFGANLWGYKQPNRDKAPGRTPFVYLFTVSDTEHCVENGSLGRVKIPAKKLSERYSFVFSLPEHVINVDIANVADYVDEFNTIRTPGLRVMIDLIDPENLTNDLNRSDELRHTFSFGRNLAQYGVFCSLTNPPSEEEILKAEKRQRDYYKLVWERMRALLMCGNKLSDDEYRSGVHAAEFLGVKNFCDLLK